MGDNIRVGNDETESNGRRYWDTPLDFASTMRSLRVEMQSYIENNESLVKAQEDKNQLNASMLLSLTDIQRRMDCGNRESNPKGSKSGAKRRKRSSSGSSNSEGSTGGLSSSSHRDKRKRRYYNSSHDEFKKERPPTFNGEVKSYQEANSWLLYMKKYF